MSQRADKAFPPDRKRYGGEMDTVMASLRLPLPAAVCALQDRWPHAGNDHLAFVPTAQDHLAWGNVAAVERLAYNFLREVHPTQPELPPERRLRWWRRLWWWMR